MYDWFVDVLPSLLVETVPILLLLVGFLRFRKADALAGRRILRVGAGVLAFCGVDFLLLEALPLLGLSYGPLDVPLAVLSMLRIVLLLIWMRLPLALFAGRAGLFAAQILLTAALLYGFYFEPFHVLTSHVELPAPALQPGQRVRIVQLSDPHVERTTPRERKVTEIVRAADADIIVLTGDYLNNSFSKDPRAVQDLRWLVSQFSTRYGIYAVNGSTETPERVRQLFDGLPVIVLSNQARPVDTPAGPLTIVGVSDRQHRLDIIALKRVAAPVPASRYAVLLYHKPDLIKTAAQSGIDLYLAGHTHGGQISLPFYGALFTFSIYGKQYEQGLFADQDTHLYVSRGLGMVGDHAPRARFLAPPEVVVIDLVGP